MNTTNRHHHLRGLLPSKPPPGDTAVDQITSNISFSFLYIFSFFFGTIYQHHPSKNHPSKNHPSKNHPSKIHPYFLTTFTTHSQPYLGQSQQNKFNIPPPPPTTNPPQPSIFPIHQQTFLPTTTSRPNGTHLPHRQPTSYTHASY